MSVASERTGEGNKVAIRAKRSGRENGPWGHETINWQEGEGRRHWLGNDYRKLRAGEKQVTDAMWVRDGAEVKESDVDDGTEGLSWASAKSGG